MNERTLRFWVWGPEGWVRLSLKPGQRLDRVLGGPTDEGHGWEAEWWEHRGDHVACGWHRWGRDCDGGYETGGEMVCTVANLAATESPDGTVRIPHWATVDEYRRDEYAEAAGY